MIEITIAYDRSRIKQATVSIQGVPGEACLMITKEMRQYNPNANLNYTQEIEEDADTLLRLPEDGG